MLQAKICYKGEEVRQKEREGVRDPPLPHPHNFSAFLMPERKPFIFFLLNYAFDSGGTGKNRVFQAEKRLRDVPKGKHTFQELKGLFYGQSLASKEKAMQIKAEK